MNASERYALITGATSGFGYEFAKKFAGDGYNLVLVARSSDRLEEVAGELKQKYKVDVKTISKDLFKPVSAEEIYNETKAMGIQIHALVNDAGQGEWGKFTDTDFARDIDLIQLNITSVVGLTKYYLKDMLARNEGRILQVSSLVAKFPTPLMAVYAATKVFILSFSEALINEVKDTGVTVTVLLPGAADTDFFHKAGAENTVTYRESDLQTPEEVAADGYNALMSGESKIVSGIKNKAMEFMSNLMPESMKAASMRRQMEPSDEGAGRTATSHHASEEERKEIENRIANWRKHGDYSVHEGHVHT